MDQSGQVLLFFAEIQAKFTFVVNVCAIFSRFDVIKKLRIKIAIVLDQSGQLVIVFHLDRFQIPLGWTKVAN